MAKKTNVICQSNFKSSDPEAVKEAFNKKMALQAAPEQESA